MVFEMFTGNVGPSASVASVAPIGNETGGLQLKDWSQSKRKYRKRLKNET